MKKILAISGGVDSMVMLDLAKKNFSHDDLIPAVFDHNMRESSNEDARFAANTAVDYGLEPLLCVAKKTPKSEEDAREMRYRFLFQAAYYNDGEIYTAHHLDDLVETVAINFLRGTGPRGLAVLDRFGVRRPFLEGEFGKVFDRRDILKYAAENRIHYRHDQSNTSDQYLRNRVRQKTFDLPRETKEKIFELWQKQKNIYHEIDEIMEEIIPEDLTFERAWFKKLDDEVALEILRAGLSRAGISATRPQMRDFLTAIREYEPGKKFNLPGDNLVKLNRRDFTLKIC